MQNPLAHIAERLPDFLFGSTILLVIGSVCVLCFRAPVKKQWLGEAWITAALLFGVAWMTPYTKNRMERFFKSTHASNQSKQIDDNANSLDDLIVPSGVSIVEGAELISDEFAATHNGQRKLPTETELPRTLNQRITDPIMPSLWDAIARLQSRPSLYGLMAGSLFCVLLLSYCRIMLAFAFRKTGHVNAALANTYNQVPRRRTASLFTSPTPISPISFGILRPTIIVPETLCAPENRTALIHALRHEQVHIDRYDAIGHTIINLALPFFYFNPLYWFLRSQVAFNRELIADDLAAAQSHKKDYVHELIRLLRKSQTPSFTTLGVLGMFRLQTPFTRRMAMLLNRKNPLQGKTNSLFRVAFTFVILACGISVLALAPQSVGAGSNLKTPEEEAQPAEKTVPRKPTIAAEEGFISVETPDAAGPEVNSGRTERSSDPVLTKIVGFVFARDLIDVASPMEGVVKDCRVAQGDVVKKGDLLIRFDNTKAEANLTAAKVEYISLRKSAKDGSVVELAKNKLNVARQKLEFLHDARRSDASSVSNVKISEQELEVLKSEIELRKTIQEQEQNELQVELAGEKLKLAEFTVSQSSVRAPMNGVVTQVYRQPTEWAKAGAPLCRILRMDQMVVRGSVSATDFHSSELENAKAVVVFRLARGETFEIPGKTSFVSPEIDESARFQVHVECKNQKRNGRWLISPGMPAEIRFLTDSNRATAESGTLEIPPTTKVGISNAEEINYLKDLVKSASRTRDVIRARYDQGLEGGSAADVAMADLHLKTALAKLAIAQGKFKDAVTHYKSATAAAQEHLKTLQVQVESGNTKYELLIQAQNNLAQTKLDYLRVLKAVAADQKR